MRPQVWRRLLVPPSILLPALHHVFQAALGWTNSHLHEFIINGQRNAEPNPEWIEEMKQRDERRVQLEQALGRRSRTFEYVYDFGDDWRHAVVVEDQFVPPRAPFAPVCLAGENACPPEDVGGAPGYAQFLAEGRKGFDPARFDREAVNQALSTLRLCTEGALCGTRSGGVAWRPWRRSQEQRNWQGSASRIGSI